TVPRGARHCSRHDAAVADPVAARILSAVLRRPDGLGRAVRARDLWRPEQLVRLRPRLGHLDRHGGADGRSVAMPLIAQLAMQHSGWRFGWLAIGSLTLVAGFLPVWLFMVRRPEDLGLVPDPPP